jgi:predicted ATPase/class 3 adenylate cyclase
MAEQPSGTVSFFFSDIEGSTRLLADLGRERYAEVLREHHRLLRTAFTRHQGYEVDCEGDAFFVTFQSAESAVRAAAEIQSALATHDWPEGVELRVRIGIHTGEALLEPPNYVGMDVHRAARIMAAGHGGQVLVSQATRELVSDGELRELGSYRLKDLSAPERLYQLGDGVFPALKTLYHTNLPVPATQFLGRECELNEIGALLGRDDVRLLTLTGPGGTGKTRLALQATGVVAERYDDGVWWVPLASLGDASLVLATVAQVLGAKRDLPEHVGDRRLLLLLDNFEHLIEAAADLAAVLAACPNMTVLVTSRERLQLAGEHEYAVPPLAPPEGVALFLARAGALGVVVEANGPVHELCDRLDNLPLALELAAARTKLFSPAQLLERLAQRLDLFKGGRDADPRQRTLRATIEWSYDLLTSDEQELLARLSVFAGGCTFEAAREICGADEDVLQSLLDKSLLRRRVGPEGEPRLWMLETIGQFAAERLSKQDPNEEIRRRHAAYYAYLGGQLQESIRNGDARATSWVMAELDNLRSGLEWAAQKDEPRHGFTIVWALWSFWWTHGLASEGLRWAHWAVTEADKLPPAERAFGLLGASELVRFYGDPELALRIKRELVPILRDLGEEGHRHFPATIADMAAMAARAGDFEEARRLANEALALQQERGLSAGIAHALGNRGEIEFLAGDFTLARSLYERALGFAEEAGAATSIATAALMVGESVRRAGDACGAKPLLRRAAGLFVELGERNAFPELLQEAAALADATNAARLLSAAERLEDEMGASRWDPADCERTLAIIQGTLPAEAFSAASQEGRSLSDEEALELALEFLE